MKAKILLLSAGFVMLTAAPSSAVPAFARKFNVSCQKCHVHPPKLNAYGELFAARGYRADDLTSIYGGIPVSVWSSFLTQNSTDRTDRFRVIPNRIEVISAGRTDRLRTTYFMEWRALSREFSGTGYRNRSGRFEDLYVASDLTPNVQLWVGQYRALTQFDVSRRLPLSEPLAFSQSLPGTGVSGERITGLRGFAPSGRSPSIRLLGFKPDSGSQVDGWYGVATLPFTGEISAPIGNEAHRNASFEFEDTAKGVFFEAYRKMGLSSLGLNYFTGSDQRKYTGAVGTHKLGNLYFLAAAARATGSATREWRYSGEMEYIPSSLGAVGLRVDHRTGPNLKPLFIPYISIHGPGTDFTTKAVLEVRMGENRKPQAVMEFSLIL